MTVVELDYDLLDEEAFLLAPDLKKKNMSWLQKFCITLLLMIMMLSWFAMAFSSPAVYKNAPIKDDPIFDRFVKRFNKTYKSADELSKAKQLFYDHYKVLLVAVQTQPQALFDLREWMDRPIKEVIEKYSLMSRPYSKNREVNTVNIASRKNRTLPSEISWINFTLPVRDQGKCGSSAFATVAVAEASIGINANEGANQTNWNVQLSEQDLIDCSRHFKMGCREGTVQEAMMSAYRQGISPASEYPYTQSIGECRHNNRTAIHPFEWSVVRLNGTEIDMELFVAFKGPVTTEFFVPESLLYYKGGVFNDDNCIQNGLGTQYAAVIGYGVEHGMDYWLVKNSWGADWGDNGYFKIARGKNMCDLSRDSFQLDEHPLDPPQYLDH